LAELGAVVARADEPEGPRPCLVGPLGTGRRTALGTVLAAQGRGVFTVELERLAQDEKTFVSRVAGGLREAVLRGAVPLLRGDTLFDDRQKWDPVAERLGELVDRHPGPVVFTARQPVAHLAQNVRHVVDVAFPAPTTGEQRAAWEAALNQPDGAQIGRALSERFTVTPGSVHHAVADARARRRFVGLKGPITEDDLVQAVRRRLDHALSNVAEPFSTSVEWRDVVLPDEVMESLKDIIAQAKHRERVFDDWGMRRKMSYGRGLACMFSGPPGTGKTMMAALIAKTLGRELYKVDVSRIVSKWVGETEKNLARVFDEAEKAQVILLFDEADSLFSSRTEVKGSNDRFANMEVNYLLQRMESYDGMSLLTTNLEKSIDEAFKRRLKFRVHFPLPDADDRAELWRRMLPEAEVVSQAIDFPKLGKRFQMSGGNIKNAVLRACFFAADEQVTIDDEMLWRAAKAEAREMGRLF
ncbi:MAG: ATP-binding protein, partial [Myxococcales bacterium]|nr:ATP-binding protein [Myxococcales bacterium]